MLHAEYFASSLKNSNEAIWRSLRSHRDRTILHGLELQSSSSDAFVMDAVHIANKANTVRSLCTPSRNNALLECSVNSTKLKRTQGAIYLFLYILRDETNLSVTNLT